MAAPAFSIHPYFIQEVQKEKGGGTSCIAMFLLRKPKSFLKTPQQTSVSMLVTKTESLGYWRLQSSQGRWVVGSVGPQDGGRQRRMWWGVDAEVTGPGSCWEQRDQSSILNFKYRLFQSHNKTIIFIFKLIGRKKKRRYSLKYQSFPLHSNTKAWSTKVIAF